MEGCTQERWGGRQSEKRERERRGGEGRYVRRKKKKALSFWSRGSCTNRWRDRKERVDMQRWRDDGDGGWRGEVQVEERMEGGGGAGRKVRG